MVPCLKGCAPRTEEADDGLDTRCSLRAYLPGAGGRNSLHEPSGDCARELAERPSSTVAKVIRDNDVPPEATYGTCGIHRHRRGQGVRVTTVVSADLGVDTADGCMLARTFASPE
jgi:hypothetical protein